MVKMLGGMFSGMLAKTTALARVSSLAAAQASAAVTHQRRRRPSLGQSNTKAFSGLTTGHYASIHTFECVELAPVKGMVIKGLLTWTRGWQ